MSEQEQAPSRCEFDTDKLVIKHEEVVLSDVTIIDATVAKIIGVIRQNYCCGDMANIDLALREALVNAIVHGNRSNAKKAVRICVAVQQDCGILIIVKDTGLGFEPNRLPNPVVGQALLAEHGRGIFLIKQLMDDVRFNFDGGTSIYMRKGLRANSE
jgi:anti-sigma regulatory factor (Ser/Thr protein kinase)